MNTCFSPKYESAIILNISIHFYSTQFQFNFYKPVKEWETGQSDHTLTPQVFRLGLGRFCQKSSLGVTITGQACRLWATGRMGQPSSWECLLLFSHSVVSNFLWSHGLQHASLPCPSPSPKTCSNSCPLSQWRHPTISPSIIPFSSCLHPFPASGYFLMSWLFEFRWPEYWSFSFCISHSNNYSGLISFRIDWFDLFVVQGTLKSLLQHHSLKASILRCSAFFLVQLSHPFLTTAKTIALTVCTKNCPFV